MHKVLFVFLLSLSSFFVQATANKHSIESPLVSQAKKLAESGDFLGFRIWVRKSYPKKIRYNEWYELRKLVNTYADRAGFDLILFWNARNPKGQSNLDHQLESADALMLSGKFEDAFSLFQKQAQQLKLLRLKNSRLQSDIDVLYPFVLHSMARALYGAGRYADSLSVYNWIRPGYPRYRQILFEKMWAAFKAGRVEIALGAIASQRSAYFSTFLSPESYLIQTYIYKKLCRDEELKEVIEEMKKSELMLKKSSLKNWVKSDIESMVLWHVSEQKAFQNDLIPEISKADRDREKWEIREALKKAFRVLQPKLLSDLKIAIAYSQLADVTDTKQELKPIPELKSREQLLKLDLEIWPADTHEDWADEVGRHVLIGESLCKH